MTEKTKEELAAEAAAKKAAADAEKAEKKAAKEAAAAEAKAKKEVEKAAKKEANEAAKAAKQAEREAKKAAKLADAQAKKDKLAADKAAKEQAKADAKALREASRPLKQNGIALPKKGTVGDTLWTLFASESEKLQQPVSIKRVKEAIAEQGLVIAPASVLAGYARWKKFHGLSGRITEPVAAAS